MKKGAPILHTNLLDYLKVTSERVPARTAVIDGDRNISFLDLSEDAKKLSGIINRKVNGIIRKPVAVLLDKQIETIVANISIIFSGNAYMNLDTKTPVQRICNIIKLIEPELIITNNKFMPKLEVSGPARRC